MKKLLFLLVFIPLVSFGQKEEIIIDKKKERNWYEGSMIPLISPDKNLTIGFRYNKGYYLDFKSNFGWWGRDKPSNPSTVNYYSTNISHVIFQTENNLVQPEAHIDKFDAVYVLNAGYNYPLVKSKKITMSLFAGIGLALTREVTYDRYVAEGSWHPFQGTWWAEKRNPNTNVNINAGIELAFKKGGGILIGMDSYTSSFNLGWVIPFVSNKSTLDDMNFIINGIDLRNIDTYTIKEMINFFILDCKRNGINIPENQTILSEFVSNLEEDTIAKSYGINNDNIIHVLINDKSWLNASQSRRWFIIYHELGHDILNLKHGEGGVMMFTRPTKPNYSWNDFLTGKRSMFENFKKGK